ncbi:hypothetical protein BKA64DRAFT_744350 [Cadophora sp. MPI-SDFR-AT-0126]|nr:hypothetical protein BKA64DRAFT_744350 [Leotiomycetes sp. MPI-SDFR-AT-0126]
MTELIRSMYQGRSSGLHPAFERPEPRNLRSHLAVVLYLKVTKWLQKVKSWSSKSFCLHAIYGKENLRSQVDIKWKGGCFAEALNTTTGEMINPTGREYYTLLDFAARFDCPEFVPQGKAIIQSRTDSFVIGGVQVPKLATDTFTDQMTFFRDTVVAHCKAGEPVVFTIVVNWSDTDWMMIDQLKNKLANDKVSDPVNLWDRDSLDTQLLQVIPSVSRHMMRSSPFAGVFRPTGIPGPYSALEIECNIKCFDYKFLANHNK